MKITVLYVTITYGQDTRLFRSPATALLANRWRCYATVGTRGHVAARPNRLVFHAWLSWTWQLLLKSGFVTWVWTLEEWLCLDGCVHFSMRAKVPWDFRSRGRKFHVIFVPRNERSKTYSLQRTKVPHIWKFRSRERKFLRAKVTVTIFLICCIFIALHRIMLSSVLFN